MVSVVAPAFMTTNPADLVTLIVVVFLAKKLNLAVMTALAVALMPFYGIFSEVPKVLGSPLK